VHERFFAAASERLGADRALELDRLIGTFEQCADARTLALALRKS
jgi:hypothetical protein